MRKGVSTLIATVAMVALGATSSYAAAEPKDGSVSCEIYQKGGVQAAAWRDVAGFAPGGRGFAYDWGTSVKRTYRINGTAVGGGTWHAESQYDLDQGATYGYCYGG